MPAGTVIGTVNDNNAAATIGPMPLGFTPTKYARPGQVFVPEGHPIIAQRFNVGNQRP